MILQLFGTFAAQVDGRPLPPLRSRKGHWLLALLTLQRGGQMDRARLAGLLWPDSAHALALYNVRRALTELREVMGSDAARLSSPKPHILVLDLSGAQVDLLAFDAAVARGDEASLESAVDLYRGPLLEECCEEWVLPEQRRREEAYLAALESLAGHAVARGDPATAIRRLRQAVAVDPLRETAQQALLKGLLAAEDTIGALLAYRAFRLRLHQELRAEPSSETKALFQQLRARARRRSGSAPKGEGTAAAPGRTRERTREAGAVLSAPRRLPRPLSPFVGRDTALHAVEACLENARLVTLMGPGGVGKTRLAIQVADAIADDHVDGVWFVDLTRLSEPALVPQAVASVLAVPEEPDRPLTETLAEFLRSKELLLVLDNCEHLLPACVALLEALLSTSPELRVLATSRQSLGLAGEVAWQLPGLSVPPPAFGDGCSVWGTAGPNPEYRTPNTEHPSDVLQFEAVRLFVERGMGASSAFSLTERSAGQIAQICRWLEGIPLAIELAAARLKALSVEEIAARLDDSLRLLTGGSRTAPPRQQTLRATMDWSYELLSPPERLLLQRLSVFVGSFSLKAVEAICRGPGAGDRSEGTGVRDQGSVPARAPMPFLTPDPRPLTPDALDLLTQLVDKSLVVVEAAPETRYRLLETVRQYAGERLRAGDSELHLPGGGRPAPVGDEERVRRRHLEFYLRLAEDVGPSLWGPDQAAGLERLDVERDNLRAALDWALEHEPEREMSLRLAAALARYWIQRRHLEEGRQRLSAALERAGPARHSPAGARALTHLGDLSFLADDYPAARAFYEAGLALQRELGDPIGAANALWGLGHVARRQKEYMEARAVLEESLAICRARGDRQGIAGSLIGLADSLREQGADPSAWAHYYEEALAIRRELGDRAGVADALGELANAAWRQGDYARARRHREESLALWRATGSPIGVIHSLGALGHLARDQGEYDDARACYTESLRLRLELGDRYTLVQALEDFAELAAREGQWTRTTRLFGAAQALWEGMDKPLDPQERGEYERFLSGARAALGDEAAAAEWERGRALSLEEATALALQTGAL